MIAGDTIAITPDNHDHDYSGMLTAVGKSFDHAVSGQTVLFDTDAADLYDIYLDSFPYEFRQLHTCHACQRFIETYGALVTISPTGHLTSVMWQTDDVPDFYRPAFVRLKDAVERATVTSAFYATEKNWGNRPTEDWSHLMVVPPAALRHSDRLNTPEGAVAKVKEDVRIVAAAITAFKPATIDEAIRVLQAGRLTGSQQYVAPLQWLRLLYDRPKGKHGRAVLWRAVTLAPAGFKRPRTGMVGTLLDDLAAGLPFAAIERKWTEKMNPLVKSRPQAAPTAGNIKAAEAIIGKLGLEPSLHRRFLRFDEVPEFIWTPGTPQPDRTAGVFGHLTPKGGRDESPAVDLPRETMTWVKFVAKVLPTATAIELLAPYSSGAYHALLTAENADAPPIIKWDREDARNPVSWYLYPTGSEASAWGLRGGKWTKVTGITPFPTQWASTGMDFLASGAFLLLDRMKDSRTNAGNALFPNFLKDDLHEVRATIEAYSKTAKIGGREEASANGYAFRANEATVRFPTTILRVTAGKSVTEYSIDRWD